MFFFFIKLSQSYTHGHEVCDNLDGLIKHGLFIYLFIIISVINIGLFDNLEGLGYNSLLLFLLLIYLLL
jgi:hypothetical protein